MNARPTDIPFVMEVMDHAELEAEQARDEKFDRAKAVVEAGLSIKRAERLIAYHYANIRRLEAEIGNWKAVMDANREPING